MKYRVSPPKIGRFFSLPCSAVDNYIKLADAEFYKALLCVFCADSDVFSAAEIASRCGISEKKAEEAVIFWSGEGVFELSPLGESEQTKPKAVEAAKKESTEEKPAEPKKTKAVVKYSPHELVQRGKDESDIGMLYEEIQKIFGRTINPHEIAAIINIYDYYGFSAPSIIIMAQHCMDMGKNKVSYLEKIAKDWFEKGITEYPQVEAEIIRRTEQYDFECQAARVLNLRDGLVESQRAYLSKWREWGFSLDMFSLAADISKEMINKIDLKYIDGIIKNWKKEEIFTPAEARERDKKYEETKKGHNKQTAEQTSFDLESWRQIAESFDPNKIGFKEEEQS